MPEQAETTSVLDDPATELDSTHRAHEQRALAIEMLITTLLRGGVAMGKAFVQWADESLATLKQMRSAK